MIIMAEGKLYIVSTPIGNLEDMTLRALRILKEADLVAAEDTRRTGKLLKHYDISAPLTSCHAFNEHRKVGGILEKVLQGLKVAFVSDSGTPAVSDPGFLIVREAVAMGIEPVVIPGVSALTFAICACGMPVDSFSFYGFLPVKKGKREKLITEMVSEKHAKTSIIFESPHKIGRTLAEIAELAPPNTMISIIREATKIHEEVIRGPVKEILEMSEKRSWKGECVIVISKSNSRLSFSEELEK